ncbi:MAG TPA: hypothetical protein VH436_19210 [Vicinamibacterales bacterium]
MSITAASGLNVSVSATARAPLEDIHQSAVLGPLLLEQAGEQRERDGDASEEQLNSDDRVCGEPAPHTAHLRCGLRHHQECCRQRERESHTAESRRRPDQEWRRCRKRDRQTEKAGSADRRRDRMRRGEANEQTDEFHHAPRVQGRSANAIAPQREQ